MRHFTPTPTPIPQPPPCVWCVLLIYWIRCFDKDPMSCVRTKLSAGYRGGILFSFPLVEESEAPPVWAESGFVPLFWYWTPWFCRRKPSGTFLLWCHLVILRQHDQDIPILSVSLGGGRHTNWTPRAALKAFRLLGLSSPKVTLRRLNWSGRLCHLYCWNFKGLFNLNGHRSLVSPVQILL